MGHGQACRVSKVSMCRAHNYLNPCQPPKKVSHNLLWWFGTRKSCNDLSVHMKADDPLRIKVVNPSSPGGGGRADLLMNHGSRTLTRQLDLQPPQPLWPPQPMLVLVLAAFLPGGPDQDTSNNQILGLSSRRASQVWMIGCQIIVLCFLQMCFRVLFGYVIA